MRPSEGGSKKKKKKGEVWCTRNPPAHRQLSVYPLQDTGTEHEGPSGEPAGIRSPSDSPADRCCCGASTLGSQGTCLGPATGSGGMEPRLGAFLPLMVSARHTDMCGDTHRDKCHMQSWLCLCLRARTGTEAKRGGRYFGPSSPSQRPLTTPLKKPQTHLPHRLIQ